MNLEDKISDRRAELLFGASEVARERGKRLRKLTEDLISEIVREANARSELRPVEKRR
jgi:hypothetical protein